MPNNQITKPKKVSRWRATHKKKSVQHRLTRGGDGNTVYTSEFFRGAHFNDDVLATLQAQVARCARCCHVEGNPMVLCCDGQLVCAHFVGCVAIGNHSVCTYHHSWGGKSWRQEWMRGNKCRKVKRCTRKHTCDVHFSHGECCHAVGDESGRDSLCYRLIRSQSGSLVERPGLRAVHTFQPAQRVEATHHACTHAHTQSSS